MENIVLLAHNIIIIIKLCVVNKQCFGVILPPIKPPLIQTRSAVTDDQREKRQVSPHVAPSPPVK